MLALTRRMAFSVAAAASTAVVLPPLSNLSGRLFSFHMAQHLILIGVVAPLLACASGGKRVGSLRLMQCLTTPVAAWSLFVCVFLFWHWSVPMHWAAEREGSRLFELATILTSAWLFWSMVLQPGLTQAAALGARALALTTAAIAIDLPGVIMIFSPRAYCSVPNEDAAHWGLTALEDQQIAGLLMWIPANLLFFGIAIWLFSRWMSEDPPKPTTGCRAGPRLAPW